jgi:zinc/manganese transport system substrate-binding protein
VIATVIPGGDTLAEPSGRHFAQLIETLDEAGVSAIFADATSPSTLADTVAAETGREILVVEIFTDSLGEPGSGADTYLGMIRTNAARVAEALTP